MSLLSQMSSAVTIPALIPVRQKFRGDSLPDIPAAIRATMDKMALDISLPPSGEIAIAVGSRGIANLPAITHEVVLWFRNRGLAPFIVPAMGSHGGATAEGQAALLGELGVTEESAGCPIRSSLDVVELDRLENGLPVYMDKIASQSSNTFVINRIKAHSSFFGDNESGLVKMLVIGLGKQKGAEACHQLGNHHFPKIMPQMARLMLAARPGIIGGLGIVENARDKTFKVEAIPAQELVKGDARLLIEAKRLMPSLPLDEIDLLIVDRLGKNISGSGMDTNITGRHGSTAKTGGPQVRRLVVLSLTEESHGNATGIGMADIIPQSLADQINFDHTYANVMTSTNLAYARLPMVTESEECALRCALKSSDLTKDAKIIRIRDTLSLEYLLVSQAVADLLKKNQSCDVIGSSIAPKFNVLGALDKSVWERNLWQ